MRSFALVGSGSQLARRRWHQVSPSDATWQGGAMPAAAGEGWEGTWGGAPLIHPPAPTVAVHPGAADVAQPSQLPRLRRQLVRVHPQHLRCSESLRGRVPFRCGGGGCAAGGMVWRCTGSGWCSSCSGGMVASTCVAVRSASRPASLDTSWSTTQRSEHAVSYSRHNRSLRIGRGGDFSPE